MNLLVDCYRWCFHNLIQDNPYAVGIRKNSKNNLEFAAVAVVVVVATAGFVVVVVAAAVAVDRPIDLYFWEQSLVRIPQQKHLSLF